MLRLTAAIGNEAANPATCSSPWSTVDSDAAGAPVAGRSKTWMAISPAAGAMPSPSPVAPRPTAIPATWVPCAQREHAPGCALPGPCCVPPPFGQEPEDGAKHASTTGAPAKVGWAVSTPVSMTATHVPAPLNPAAWAAVPPT